MKFYKVVLLLFLCFIASGFSQDRDASAQKFSRKTICLNMIVKNEKDVIVRCLQSVLPLIDCWVIVDTGSNDGTQGIIENFMREKNIPGTLYERPWVNFGHNRNEALGLAKDQADYILLMDADDMLSFREGFSLPDLTQDFYATTSYDGTKECTLPRLIKASLEWKWIGVIHEYITTTTTSNGSMLEGVDYIYNHDGARGKDPDTLLKDLALLRSDPTPRNIFYEMLICQELNKYEEALAACEKRVTMQGLPEEVFTAYLVKAKMEDALKKDPKLVKESLYKAYSLRPHRLEPIYYLGKKLQEEKAYQIGYELMHMAVQLPKQQEDLLFVETWIYDFGFLAQYVFFAAATGHHEEGLQAVNVLLSNKHLPEPEKEMAEKCRAMMRRQLMQEIQGRVLDYISNSRLNK